jgi:hypothetical protein
MPIVTLIVNLLADARGSEGLLFGGCQFVALFPVLDIAILYVMLVDTGRPISCDMLCRAVEGGA